MYHKVPFHNFTHAFSVFHTVWMFLRTTYAADVLNNLELFGVLLGALCHDIDHPGNNNYLEVETRSDRALLHNDSAVLERHHASTTIKLLQDENCNVLADLSKSDYSNIKHVIIDSILDTDMARHTKMIGKLMQQIKGSAKDAKKMRCRKVSVNKSDLHKLVVSMQEIEDAKSLERKESSNVDDNHIEIIEWDVSLGTKRDLNHAGETHRGTALPVVVCERHKLAECPFDSNKEQDRRLLMSALVHTADLSAQTLPLELAQKWGDMVITEFVAQVKLHEKLHIETPAWMSGLEDESERLRTQIMFIERTVMPLYEVAADLFPTLETLVMQLESNRDAYTEMLLKLRGATDDDFDDDGGNGVALAAAAALAAPSSSSVVMGKGEAAAVVVAAKAAGQGKANLEGEIEDSEVVI